MLSRNRGVYVAVKRSGMMLREGPNKHVYFRAAVTAGGNAFLTLEAGDSLFVLTTLYRYECYSYFMSVCVLRKPNSQGSGLLKVYTVN
jgi:hypothetical protein